MQQRLQPADECQLRHAADHAVARLDRTPGDQHADRRDASIGEEIASRASGYRAKTRSSSARSRMKSGDSRTLVIETPACGRSSPDRLSCSRPEIAVAAFASPRSDRCSAAAGVGRSCTAGLLGHPWAFSKAPPSHKMQAARRHRRAGSCRTRPAPLERPRVPSLGDSVAPE
jgi:hypothetical protein